MHAVHHLPATHQSPSFIHLFTSFDFKLLGPTMTIGVRPSSIKEHFFVISKHTSSSYQSVLLRQGTIDQAVCRSYPGWPIIVLLLQGVKQSSCVSDLPWLPLYSFFKASSHESIMQQYLQSGCGGICNSSDRLAGSIAGCDVQSSQGGGSPAPKRACSHTVLMAHDIKEAI